MDNILIQYQYHSNISQNILIFCLHNLNYFRTVSGVMVKGFLHGMYGNSVLDPIPIAKFPNTQSYIDSLAT